MNYLPTPEGKCPRKDSSPPRPLALSLVLVFAAFFPFAACGDDATQETLCSPSELIFCKCRGNRTGLKECNSAGDGYLECIPDGGEEACEEIPDASGAGGGNNTGTGTGMNTGAGGAGGGTGLPLLSACVMGTECATGQCEQGFCTKPCGNFEDCDNGTGECINFGSANLCAPYCRTNDNNLCDTSECNIYGAPSTCGVGTATDGLLFTVCGDWPAGIPLPPEGTPCAEDCECNLNNDGVERVCYFDQCVEGCFVPQDCPAELTCSSSGSAGTCG